MEKFEKWLLKPAPGPEPISAKQGVGCKSIQHPNLKH